MRTGGLKGIKKNLLFKANDLQYFQKCKCLGKFISAPCFLRTTLRRITAKTLKIFKVFIIANFLYKQYVNLWKMNQVWIKKENIKRDKVKRIFNKNNEFIRKKKQPEKDERKIQKIKESTPKKNVYEKNKKKRKQLKEMSLNKWN